MTLNQKILDAARDEVAKRYGYSNWQTALSSFELATHYHNEAALLAMEKQAEFFRNLSGWVIVDRDFEGEPIYECVLEIGPQQTETQLYEIWEGQK